MSGFYRAFRGRLAPCTFCGRRTAMRDDGGRPTHKACAARARAAARKKVRRR